MNGNPLTVTGSNEIMVLSLTAIKEAGLDPNTIIGALNSGVFLETEGRPIYRIQPKETFIKTLKDEGLFGEE